MKNYAGITSTDTTDKGGSWVEKNNDAHEQWNFLNYDGHCYGFVMNKGEQFAIERIDEKSNKSEKTDCVTVVWCAYNSDVNETVIVGWYENATVYRYFQNSVSTPMFGIDRMYFTKAKAEDCYLLPEESRTFVIGRASKNGSGRGFGQQNFWYAESAYARSELIPEVFEYIETHRNTRINLVEKDFDAPKNVLVPLTEEENQKATELFDNAEYWEFLPYGYRSFYKTKSADDAYFIAKTLSSLHQYTTSLKWYEKLIEIEGESWDINSCLPYLYQQCELHEKSTESAVKLLHWLDKILSESDDKELLNYTAETKKSWKELL